MLTVLRRGYRAFMRLRCLDKNIYARAIISPRHAVGVLNE